jgi:dTDP-4-amino-4,6-dideoxygalactose transaminase
MYKGRRTGSLGDIACISFYPTKNLGAAGDGGMIVTNSADLEARLRTLRNHGQASRYISSEPGWNSRLDEIQAAILRVKLRYLPAWQKARQANAAKYSKLLAGVAGIRTPVTPEGYEHVFHQYTIRSTRRDVLQKFLSERKIGSTIYYPVPLHLQPLYSELGHKPGDFPNAEHVAGEILSLPMYPELSEDKIERAAAAIAEFARS